METMKKFEIKNLSELVDPSLEKIRTMSKLFSLTEFYELENKLAVIAITPTQVVIAYAPTFIDDNNSNQKLGHYVMHRELSAMINKKIYEGMDILGKSDPMIKLYCYTDSISCFCHPYKGQQNAEKMIITQSMLNVIKHINKILFGIDKEIDFFALEKIKRITPDQCEEDLNIVSENLIGLTHTDFIQMLENERDKVNMLLEDFER